MHKSLFWPFILLSLLGTACEPTCDAVDYRIIYRYSDDGLVHSECKTVSGTQCLNCSFCHEEHYVVHSMEEASKFDRYISLPAENEQGIIQTNANHQAFWKQINFESEDAIILFTGYRVATSYAFSVDEACTDRIRISLVSCSSGNEGSSANVGIFVVPKGEYQIEYQERRVEDCQILVDLGYI